MTILNDKHQEGWIEDEMTNAIDAGCFSNWNDPELRAYAERGWIRHCAEMEEKEAEL
jgi:hypothetical protein